LVYLNGKIYKFCGTAAASTAVMEVYDVATNTWSAGTPYPVALSFVNAIASGGKIYACGGVATATLTASAATYEFDPGTNAWTLKAPMAAQHWGHAGAFYNNGFAVAGGYINGATTIGPNAELYNIGSNTWGPLPNLPTATARVGGAATGIGGSFYVIGGRTLASAGFVGSTQNQKLFCIPPTPCSGTPAPGNTISSTAAVCSGTPFTLSLQNNPFVSGFTYQWQSAPASTGPWTNLPGASTNITYSGTQTGATWYRCIVTCTPSGLSGTSNPVLVADGQGVFNTQPVNTSTQCSGSAVFSYTATGNSLTYAWEFRTTPTGFWYNVTPGHPLLLGTTVTGENTNTLTLGSVPSTLNGYQFRGTIVGPCTAIDFTNVVTLTVTPIVATVNQTSPVSICTGTVVPLTLTNASSPATTTFASGPISVQIPDMTGPPASPPAVCNAGINHTIPVSLPAGSQISRIDLRLNITHTYASDLIIVLKNSTTNQVLNLFYHKSGAQTAGANFTNTVISSAGTTRFSAVPPPFTGTFRADWELSPGSYGDVTGAGPTAFQPTTQSWNALWGGVNQGSGNWTIAICDPQEWAGDIGTLTSWSMDITYGAPAAGTWTQTTPASPNSMFTDPAATIPYTGGLANTIYVKPLATAPFTGNSATYCVVYSTATPACTSNPTCVTVNVSSPITGLTTPADKTVCVGSNTSFSVSPGGGPLTYQWQVSVNNGLTWSNIAGATGPTLDLTAVTQLMNNNLYRVIVNASPCGSAITTAPGKLTVNQLPTVTISSTTLQLVPGRTATITATSLPAAGAPPPAPWSWTLNGSIIAGAITNTVTANIDQQGEYQATVRDINGCVNSSNIVTIGSQVSDNLWIYPNPNQGSFQVRLYYNGVQGERRIVRIYDGIGKLVAQKEFDLDSNTPPYLSMTFDLPLLAAGTYAVKVVDKNGGKITSGLMVIQ
jgi:subtilisin-like proprotein convertase family protein